MYEASCSEKSMLLIHEIGSYDTAMSRILCIVGVHKKAEVRAKHWQLLEDQQFHEFAEETGRFSI